MTQPNQTAAQGFGASAVMSNLICMASMVIWATGFPAAGLLLETWDPLMLIAARMALALIFLFPIWVVVDGFQAVRSANWPRGLMVGGIGFGGGAYMLLYGQSVSDAVTVTVVSAGMPAVAAVLEVALDGRRLRVPFVLGVLLAFAGGVVAATGSVGGGDSAKGAFFAFLSIVVFAWASRATVRDFPSLSALGQTTITLTGAAMFSGLALAVFLVLGGVSPLAAPVDGAQIMYLLIYSLASMAVAQLLWIMGVGRLGIAVSAIHLNAAPFYVMLMVVALGGNWSWLQVLSALLVAAGVLVAQLRRRTPVAAPVPLIGD